ncbi:MAG: hypothetical protein E7473_06745 [Ruminococcaceae bacterium]|nr:hypothetical protein [Oscillospiraceae bacterium]
MKKSSKITPVPQKLQLGDSRIEIGRLASADFKIITENISGDLACFAYDMLCERLSKKLSVCAEKAKGNVKIILSLSEKVPCEVIKNQEQAYEIKAKGNEITLTGFGEAGLYYAVTTLCQCIEFSGNVAYVSEMSLLDWPDMRTRGHFMECRYGSNLMELEDWKAVVDDMAEMKLNQLVVALYGSWCIQYDGVVSEYVYIPLKCYPEISASVIKKYYSPSKGEWINETVPTPMAQKDFFGELIAYGKARGVEVAPLWNSYGHNSLIPRLIPSISAKNENGELTGFGLCLSNSETYDVLFNIYDEIIEKYLKPNGIESFHIGLDEVRTEIAIDPKNLLREFSPWCMCPDCAKLSNEEKFINHAIKLIRHLKSRGMKNVYIYADMLINVVDPKKFRDILSENDILDVTVLDWWTYRNDKERMMFKTMHPELNMRSTVKPWNSYYHWDMTFDAVPNTFNLCELAEHEGCAEGLQSYSAWDKVCDKNHVSMADYSWNFKGTGTVSEYNERYAYRRFGNYYDEAKEALSLMDKMTDEGIGNAKLTETNVGKGMGNVTLLRSLTYYVYSYVRANKPYPRNFPGEPFANLLDDLDTYKKQLRDISEMAHHASRIFEKLSNYADCDNSLAKRLDCEARNYGCIADDYLALIEVYELMENKERSAVVSRKVATIAKERKEARLSLMLAFERTKEEFLLPSHLRNQSIFMQLFADIENYAVKTEPLNLDLNMCDLSGIGSKNFFALR